MRVELVPAPLLSYRQRVSAVVAPPPVTLMLSAPVRVTVLASGGWPGLVYRRLHGHPVVYRSPYDAAALDALAAAIAGEVAGGVPSWCLFDNTASGAAAGDALALAARLGDDPGG